MHLPAGRPAADARRGGATESGRFPAPAGAQLCAVVGGAESDEFLRQNRLIRERWGDTAVPVCEELPGRNHFSVLDELVEPQADLHRRVADWLSD